MRVTDAMLGEDGRRLEELLEVAALPFPPFESQQNELVVYGAGNCGRDVASLLRRHGFTIAGFVDARGPSIRKVGETECAAPGSEQAQRWAAAGLPIVLAVFNYATDAGAIARQLQQVGFQRIISLYELFEWWPELPSPFWLTPRRSYCEHAPELTRCLELWADQRSRQIFLDTLALRITHDLELLRQPDQANQYLAKDVPSAREPIRLVDGGAFVGDTIQSFLQSGRRFSGVAAFEPDLDNFFKLRDYVVAAAPSLGDALLFPCGLSEQTGTCRFQAGKGGASSLSADGSSSIQVVALDDVLPTFAPTFIKLDVEGAEPAALRGARRTLERHCPDVAASVYHAPQHLWEVPLLLHELQPQYSFKLRYHQFNGFDTVVYAYRR